MNEGQVTITVDLQQHQLLMSAVIQTMESMEYTCPILQEMDTFPEHPIGEKYRALKEIRQQLTDLWDNRFATPQEPIETPDPGTAEVIIDQP